MKYALIMFCFGALFSSCKREHEITAYDRAKNYNAGTGSALINGKPYVGQVVTAIHVMDNTRISVGIEVFNGNHTQNIDLSKINPGKSSQVVYGSRKYNGAQFVDVSFRDSCMGSFSMSEDDVGENSYQVWDDAPDNWLNIESYSSDRIKGSFSMTVFRRDPDHYPQTQGMPDTLRITNGKFDVFIK